MEENKLQISEETLQNITIDEIAELKVETEDLLGKLDNIIETCDEALNA